MVGENFSYFLQDVLPIKVKEKSNSVEELEDSQGHGGGRREARKEEVGVKKAAVKRAFETKITHVESSRKQEPRKALERTGHQGFEVKRRQSLDTSDQEDRLRQEALRSIQSRSRITSRDLPEEETTGGEEDVPCKYYTQGNCSQGDECHFRHGKKETVYIIDKSVTLKTIDVEKHMANFGEVGRVKLVGLGPRGSEFEVKLALNPAQWALEDMTKLTLWIGGVRVLVEDPPLFRHMSRAQRTRSDSCSSRDDVKVKDWQNQWSRRREDLATQEMSRQDVGDSSVKRTRRESNSSSSGTLLCGFSQTELQFTCLIAHIIKLLSI